MFSFHKNKNKNKKSTCKYSQEIVQIILLDIVSIITIDALVVVAGVPYNLSLQNCAPNCRCKKPTSNCCFIDCATRCHILFISGDNDDTGGGTTGETPDASEPL